MDIHNAETAADDELPEKLVWGAERSSRIQPARLELESGDDPWRIDRSPWWLRCRLDGSNLQVAVRNCGRHRGAIRLSRGGAIHSIRVESDARPTLGSGTRGAAILIVFAAVGLALGAYGSTALSQWMYLRGTGPVVQSALMAAVWGGLTGAAAGLGLGGLRLIGRSALGGAAGAVTASALIYYALLPLMRDSLGSGTAYAADLLFLVPLTMLVTVGYIWGAVVGGAWLARRCAIAGLAAGLLALPLGALVIQPRAGLPVRNLTPGVDGILWAAVWCSGPLLFTGFLGALLAPCHLPDGLVR